MSDSASTGRPFTGRHMLFITVAFFGVIAAVNVFMAVRASTSWTGLVVTNSYVASQQFETNRLAHEAQLAAGWQAEFSYSGAAVILTLHDASGAAPELGAVALQVNRPVGGHEDQSLILERTADGSYMAPLSLAPGIWEAVIAAPDTRLGPFTLRTRFRVGASP